MYIYFCVGGGGGERCRQLHVIEKPMISTGSTNKNARHRNASTSAPLLNPSRFFCFLFASRQVPPVPIRPSVAMDIGGGSNEDDLTVKLQEIIDINASVKAALDNGANVKMIMENWDFLQVRTEYTCTYHSKKDGGERGQDKPISFAQPRRVFGVSIHKAALTLVASCVTADARLAWVGDASKTSWIFYFYFFVVVLFSPHARY